MSDLCVDTRSDLARQICADTTYVDGRPDGEHERFLDSNGTLWFADWMSCVMHPVLLGPTDPDPIDISAFV